MDAFTTWYSGLQAAEQFFFIVGIISNLLFFLYVALQLLGGHDADMPDHPIDFDFALLSVRSLLAFGMFLGWTGLIVLKSGLGLPLAIAAGVSAGLLAAWLAWLLLKTMFRLQQSGNLELQNAYRQIGTVYLAIPARGNGKGKVQIVVQGALRELEAVSDDAEIPTGTKVIVCDIADNQLVVMQFKEMLI
jgi:membrane protein implicated in regulation of membrane protease activity